MFFQKRSRLSSLPNKVLKTVESTTSTSPALPLPEQAVTSGVYGQLEKWLVRLPEQWSYLSAFPGSRSS